MAPSFIGPGVRILFEMDHYGYPVWGAEVFEARLHEGQSMDSNGYPGSGFKRAGGNHACIKNILRQLTKSLRGCERTIPRPDLCAHLHHTYHFITVIIGDLSIVRFCGHDCII